MIRDTFNRMYGLALAVRKAKLWKDLSEDNLFAVRLSSGEIGYCRVFGMNMDEHTLEVYLGRKGLDGHRAALKVGEDKFPGNELKKREVIFGQLSLQCMFTDKASLTPMQKVYAEIYAEDHGTSLRGPYAYPQFIQTRPACLPWDMAPAGEGAVLMIEALEAALEVKRKIQQQGVDRLGFANRSSGGAAVPLLTPKEGGFVWSKHTLPKPQVESWPQPGLKDEALLARLRKVKERTAPWICDVAMIPQVVYSEDQPAPIFPYAIFCLNTESGEVICSDVVDFLRRDADQLVWSLADHMTEGIPREIIVVDGRTQSIVKQLARTLGIKLTVSEGEDMLDELENSLAEGEFELSEVGDAVAPSGITSADFFARLRAMSDEELLEMPDLLWTQLVGLNTGRFIPKDLSVRLRRLATARKK